MSYYVYILHSESHDRYYVGQAKDVYDRLAKHNAGFRKRQIFLVIDAFYVLLAL